MDLALRITADVDGAVAGTTRVGNALRSVGTSAQQSQKSIFNLTEELRTLQSEAFTEKDINKIKSYNIAIKSTEDEIKKLQDIGVKSSSAVVNGFNGIYGGIRKIAQILPGVGIGTIFGLALDPLIAFISKLDLLGDKLTDVQQEQKDFADSLADAGKKGISSGLQLQAFVDIAKNGALPLAQRNEALKEANDLLGKQATQLTLANVASAAATKEIETYTNALIAQAVAQKLSDRAADTIIKQTGLQKELNTALADENRARKALEDVQIKQNNRAKTIGPVGGGEAIDVDITLNAQRDLDDATAKVKLLSDAIIVAAKDVRGLKGYLAVATGDATKAFGTLNTNVGKSGETIADVLRKLQAKRDVLKNEELLFKVDKSKEEISAISSAIEVLHSKFKLPLDGPTISKLNFDIYLINLEQFKKKLANDLREFRNDGVVIDAKVKVNLTPAPLNEGGELKKIIADRAKELQSTSSNILPGSSVFDFSNVGPKPADTQNLDTYFGGMGQVLTLQKQLTAEGVKFAKTDSFGQLLKSQEQYEKNLKQLNKSFESTVNDIEIGVITDIGQGIGKLLTGAGSVGDIFKDIFNTLGDGFESLGKSLIAFALAKTVIDSFKSISPATALIAGIGLEIAGAALKSSIPSFADGVTNFAGGYALVGERGPEVLRLPQGADVISNYKQEAGQIGGGIGMSVNVQGEFVLRGNNLVASVERTMSRNGRNS